MSIIALPQLLSLGVGLDDGRLILYNLINLQAYHLAYPPEADSPLVKLAAIEPSDDPRACIYLWAYHINDKSVIAVMHSIMFENKMFIGEDDCRGDGGCIRNYYIYKNFQACSARLTMPIYGENTFPINCQSIFKQISDNNILNVCLLTWSLNNTIYICVFDLNQWYKEQMPNMCVWQEMPSYLAIFSIENKNCLDIWMNSQSIELFNSIQRPEEHFYPTALSFGMFYCLNNNLLI